MTVIKLSTAAERRLVPAPSGRNRTMGSLSSVRASGGGEPSTTIST